MRDTRGEISWKNETKTVKLQKVFFLWCEEMFMPKSSGFFFPRVYCTVITGKRLCAVYIITRTCVLSEVSGPVACFCGHHKYNIDK